MTGKRFAKWRALKIALLSGSALLMTGRASAQAGDLAGAPDQGGGTASAATAGTGTTAQAERPHEASDTRGLADIVVTAQRRSQSLQKIPVAATALSNKELERAGIQQFSDVQNNTPSLSISQGPGGRFINIRGVGLGVSAPQQSAGVPIHIDGFFIPREFALEDAYLDLARVEVLRGPQGTFVGQSSTGGAVFLVTNKPDLSGFSGDIRQTVANYDWYQTQGHVNAPISSNLAVRAAFNIERRDSFATFHGSGGPASMVLNHSDPGNLNNQSLRVEALYKPSDDFRILLEHSFSAQKNDGPASQRGLPDGSIAAPRDIYRDFPTNSDLKLSRTIALVDWDIADGVQFHSNTGYQRLKNTSSGDGDGTSPYVDATAAQSGTTTLLRQRTFNQEFTLTSAQGAFHWVAGVNYLSDIHPFVLDTVNYVLLASAPTGGNVLDYKITRYSYAGFAEGTYDFSPKFQVIVGARYTKDKSALAKGTSFKSRVATGGFGPTVDLASKASFAQPTGRVALNWFPDPDTLVYLTVSRGYKPGGIVSRLTSPVQLPPYKSEIVYNYEVGLKTTLLDKHLRASIDAYYMDYRNYQANIRIPGFPLARSQNVPKSQIYGFEGQLSAVFGDLRVNMTGSYLHTRLGHAQVVVPTGIFGPGNPSAAAPLTIDLDGLPLNFSPKITASLNAEYEIHLGKASLTPRVQYSYIAHQFYEFYQAPLDKIPGHGLLDLRLTYAAPEHWRVEGFVTNVADKLYVAGVSSGNPATPYIGQVGYGAPRQFGVRVGYSF